VNALEKADVPRALEMAQFAALHDPDDAESWLTLAAVHLYRNDPPAAAQAFKDCVEKAKVGRRDHCVALLSGR
jgi:cytochrome c-type biogenesis protein CcmH/NrfG